MRIQNLVWFVVMLLGAQAYGQRSALITDLRLREAGGTGGDVTFRHNGDAVLRSYNAAGVETATWDAESGTFTGAYSGTIPADAITAGTFQPGVLIPATSVTGAFSSLSVTGSFSQPTDQVFEVAADGSRQYTTIQAAIAAATDPLVRKVILVYPGDYTLADGVQVVLAVDNTHLKGVSREGCRISGSYRQNADADGGLFLIDGNECSIDSLTITNTARAGYTLPTHACVVKLGNIDGDGTDNPRLANCTLIAKADSYPAGGG